MLPGYEAGVPFLGTRYASNPSVPPARRLKGAEGTIVLPAKGR